MSRKAEPAFAHLGRPSKIPEAPDAKTLDRAPNPQADTDYIARFTIVEFTSICPVTGQPDFAHLVIDYAPDKWLVESKSLKLYLWSFRNHGAFHEDCTVRIGKDLVGAAQASLAQNRRLLVPARRHADRRLLAERQAAERRLAARSGRRALSRARLKRASLREEQRRFAARSFGAGGALPVQNGDVQMNRRLLLASIATVAASRVAAQTPAPPSAPAQTIAPPAPAPSGLSDAQRKHINDTMAVGSLSLMLSRIALPKANNALLKQFVEFEIAEQETVADILKTIQTNAPDRFDSRPPPTRS